MGVRIREVTFGLYADEEGLAWVRGLVAHAVGSRRARVVGETVAHTLPGSELSMADAYDYLARQWALEHPAEDSGARQLVELHLRLACSLRTWRAVRKALIAGLCPEGSGPHTCRVPWSAS